MDRLRWTVGVLIILIITLWLDRAGSPFALDRSIALRRAEVFSGVVAVLSILADWIATAAEVTAVYVWIGLQWLASVTASFLVSTGAMFARVWDGLKIVWSDVVRPALVWIDDNIKRLSAWLKDTLKPVTDFINDVRCRLHDFYDTFVKPVTDTIDFVRQVNRTLMVFHIDLLGKLDRTLQQIEARINEPFDFIERKLTEIGNVVNRIVTLDGLVQRITLLKSMSRYAPAWISGFWNGQINTVEVAARTKALRTVRPVLHSPSEPGEELGKFYRGESSDIDDNVGELVAMWRVASGFDSSLSG